MIITIDNGRVKHEWRVDVDTITFTATLHAESGDTVLRNETMARSDENLGGDIVDSLRVPFCCDKIFPGMVKKLTAIARQRS